MIGSAKPGGALRAGVLLAVLGAGPSATAGPAEPRASVTIRPPAGWRADTDGAAFTRARDWIDDGDAAPGRVVEVYTPTARDDFAEVLAILELPGAIDTTATDAAELTRALDAVPGFDAASATWSRDDFADGAPRLRASWEHDRIAYRADVVAAGASRAVLIQATLAAESALYARTFDAASASLQGAAAPRIAFDRAAWRLRTVLVGGIAIAAMFALAMWRRPMGAGARTIGRVGAGVCVLAAIVAAIVTPRALAAHQDALRTAGLGADTLAAELVTWGLAAAVILWLVGVMLARRERPVASAPTRGSFADRSSTALASVPMIPKVPPRVEPPTARRHPDGPSQLEPAAHDAPVDEG